MYELEGCLTGGGKNGDGHWMWKRHILIFWKRGFLVIGYQKIRHVVGQYIILEVMHAYQWLH